MTFRYYLMSLITSLIVLLSLALTLTLLFGQA
jgi:hypothetical protein